MATHLTKSQMLQALKRLDELFESGYQFTLVIGGGGAMVMAHGFPLATLDIDAVPIGVDFEELSPLVKKIAKELDLPGDWLNPYFGTFAHTLPLDYQTRLITVFEGKKILARALGKEDMLILKCFAHRQKDIPHAKQLIKNGADLKVVEKQLDFLQKKKVLGVDKACDFLDDIQDEI